jgi:hypothetical protein
MIQQANRPPTNRRTTAVLSTATLKGEVTMRNAISCVAICGVVILLQPRTTLADHDMTCHPPPPPSSFSGAPHILFILPGEELNLIVPGAGGATSTSCSSAGGDTLPVVPPPDSFSAIEHVPGTGQAGRYWFFEPVSQAFLDARIGQSGDLPNFIKPDGTPLLTQYRETELAFVLSLARTFTPDEVFSVSSGVIAGWQGAMVLEMPASFTLDELLAADPSRFPAYTGPAQVADIARIAVVPESVGFLLLFLGAMEIAVCQRPYRRK